MLGQRINNEWQGSSVTSSNPSHEIARVFLSNRVGEVVIYTTERGQLSFGLRSSDEDENDKNKIINSHN